MTCNCLYIKMGGVKKKSFEVIYEDEEVIVVYKEREVFSQATEDVKTYKNNLFFFVRQLLKKKGETCFLVHRLDYETSGLVIFAKTQSIQSLLKREFFNRRVKREYEAVVREKLPIGYKKEVRLFIDDSKKRVGIAKSGKECITHFEVVNEIQIGTVLNVNIDTGRHNQIRLSLKECGLTLLGDKRYSLDVSKRLYLNAYHLAFYQGVLKKRCDFALPPLWLKKEGV